MKTNRCTLNFNGVKTVRFLRYIATPLLILIVCLSFSSCAALQEAQQRREKRMAEKREKYVTLEPSRGETEIDKDKIKAEGEHYILTFDDMMKSHEDFGEPEKRSEYLRSSLSYMESLYKELHDRFGFEPEYKIHVTIYQNYKGNRRADTEKQYMHSNEGKTLKSLKMHFPYSMYQDPGVRAHELTHAFTSPYFLPLWFDEGIAVMIQAEFAKRGHHPKFDSLQKNLKRNLDGVNSLEGWEAGGSPELTHWRYSYAYTVIAELKKRYGEELFIQVFRLMEADQLHNKLPSRMSTSFLIYYLNQAAGADLVPFFQSLHFNVRRLTKAEILQHISQGSNR